MPQASAGQWSVNTQNVGDFRQKTGILPRQERARALPKASAITATTSAVITKRKSRRKAHRYDDAQPESRPWD